MEFAAGVLEFIGVGQVTDVTEQAVLALAAKVLFFLSYWFAARSSLSKILILPTSAGLEHPKLQCSAVR